MSKEVISQIVTHLITAIISAIGGWTLHCHYSSRQNKQTGDNNASNDGFIANPGSNMSNVGNKVINNYMNVPNDSQTIELSEQAKRILVEFLKSKQTKLDYLVLPTNKRELLQLSIQGVCIEVNNETINADINDLVDGHYLRQNGATDHTKHFELTHKGRDYATQLIEGASH